MFSKLVIFIQISVVFGIRADTFSNTSVHVTECAEWYEGLPKKWKIWKLGFVGGCLFLGGACENQKQSCHKCTEFYQHDLAKGNAQKLQEIIDSWKVDLLSCAQRLETLKVEVTEKADSLDSFQDSLQATQAQQLPEHTEHEGSQFAKYGSKIEMCEDATSKLICFVQWEDLKRKVPHVTLHGGAFHSPDGAEVPRFQYDYEGPRMLLLSLEESASGTNLTAANHVLIVHPMQAESKEEAVAFEMQAVGRVRRPGQQKKIYIWRFVTCDTIEQTITEEHQRELWLRQKETVPPLSLPAAQDPESDEECEESAPATSSEVRSFFTVMSRWLPTRAGHATSRRPCPCSLELQQSQLQG
ncbi:unnamed protein product [Durusdinium trenchii]|uniref:Helicase C-terminal domain-containing protein n=1 Tax=Durusdinium trenchii TaxID=1381693 RepID=A0ABP0PMD5_9DINO